MISVCLSDFSLHFVTLAPGCLLFVLNYMFISNMKAIEDFIASRSQ